MLSSRYAVHVHVHHIPRCSERQAEAAQAQLLGQLEADREAVSGVNIDEEMVDLLKYQQSYEAAARFISVAQEMTEVLINLVR